MELQQYFQPAVPNTGVRPSLKTLEKAIIANQGNARRFMLLFWEWFNRMEAWREETNDRLLALERRLPLR